MNSVTRKKTKNAKTHARFCAKALPVAALLFGASLGLADEKPAASAINGVKGVKQEAVQSIKDVAPPTAVPNSVNKADGVNTINGVKADGRDAVQAVPPPPPPPAVPPPPPPPQSITNAAPPTAVPNSVNKTDGVNTINGVKAEGHNAVQAVPPPPPPPNVVASVRAVQGVQGIAVPKQRNLEAALQIKNEAGQPTVKGQAAAAALFNGPPGGPPKPNTVKDGRADFQEFEKLNTPGS